MYSTQLYLYTAVPSLPLIALCVNYVALPMLSSNALPASGSKHRSGFFLPLMWVCFSLPQEHT